MPADPARLATLTRFRLAIGLLTVLLPLGCGGLFGRQSARLDGLAERGVAAEAVVTSVSRDGSGTFYAYDAGGARHEWNVKRADAPYDVGARFPVTVLPDVPSFSRPGADRAGFAAAAAFTRRVGAAVVGAELLAGLTILALLQRDIARARAGTPAPPLTLEGYRRRLLWTGAGLVLPAAVVVGFQVWDARSKGESLLPIAFAAALSVAIVGWQLRSAYRRGPAQAGADALRVLRWAAPIGAGLAALRLLAEWAGG